MSNDEPGMGMNTTKMRASAAAALLALGTIASLAAAPSAAFATTATAQLAIDAPLTIPNAAGNGQIWFGSLQVKSGVGHPHPYAGRRDRDADGRRRLQRCLARDHPVAAGRAPAARSRPSSPEPSGS